MEPIKCHNYSIYFDQWEAVQDLLSADYSSLLIIVDENTRKHCLPILQAHLSHDFNVIEIPSGENYKSLKTCQHIWNQMLELGMDRKGLCLNLGGGVIGDMGGFCASTFMRGIDFIQIPTTLLSMVDASVGGKLGIDLNGHKNTIGLFRNPKAVFVFPEFLKTLEPRELKSGMAEVYKHGLIADADYFQEVSALQIEGEIDWTKIIHRSVEIKKEVVEEDPLESGRRKILNFGHTLGHAIESANLGTSTHLLHGEAIALGMMAEAFLSTKKTNHAQGECELIVETLKSAYSFPTEVNLDLEAIMSYCLQDKKNFKGSIRASLLKSIGECEYNVELSAKEIEEGINYLKSIFE